MPNTYTPQEVGVTAPAGGFQTGGWYNGRQYWNGTLSDPGVIHPASNQQGAGQTVSAEVNSQSAAAQGVSNEQFNNYLQQEWQNNPAGSSAAGSPSAGANGFSGASMFSGQPAVPNLSEIYNSLFNTPEFQAKKDEVTKVETARDEAISEIQNNPWFSQATRGGKIAGINSDAERKLTRINGELTRMSTDAQVKYNIQVNQYTMNREAYNDQLNLFTSLLNAGAFTNASEQDKAQWSLATGIPTSMMDSILQTQKSKDLTLQTFDDGINTYVIALDPSGTVVNRTILGQSKYGISFGSDSEWEIVSQDQQSSPSTSSNQSPKFMPQGGIGTKYTDAAGNNWMYTANGWVQVGSGGAITGLWLN